MFTESEEIAKPIQRSERNRRRVGDDDDDMLETAKFVCIHEVYRGNPATPTEHEPNENAPKLLDLPTEILTQVFQFASETPFTIVNLSHVCKEFDELATSSPFAWQYCPCSEISKLSKQSVDCFGMYDNSVTAVIDASQVGFQCSNLLLKYFSKGPLSFKNPKYKGIYDMFEKQLSDYASFEHEDQKRRKQDRLIRTSSLNYRSERTEKDQQEIDRISYSFKRPLIVSKHQLLDQLRFLQKKEAYARKARRVQQWYADRRSKMEDRFFTGILWYISFLFLFITLAMAKFPKLPYLDFTQTATAFLPITLLMIHLVVGFTVATIHNWFRPKSESNFVGCIMLWVLLFICRFLFNNAVANTVNMIANENGYPMNSSFFTSWYLIFLPFQILTLFFVGLYYVEEIKKKTPSTPNVIRYLMLSICCLFTFTVLPVYMQGWRFVPLKFVVTPALTQFLHWSIYFMHVRRQTTYEKDRRGLLIASSLLFGLGLNLFAYAFLGFYSWMLFGPCTVIPLSFFMFEMVAR